ncbi:hypothetical protein [Nonomuraea sp. NPDC046570]|uniref:hypothetical protein n=1 Tax=Nonomuraea sp. NPDC046570 TaxID=3155255 RepID=UPI0033EDEC79
MSEMDTRGDERPFEDDELSIEAPEADAAEQHRLLREEGLLRQELPIEVDPADAADQDRTVEFGDDDDYR